MLYNLTEYCKSEKAEEPEIKLPISAGSSEKQESSRKTSISALLTIDYAKAFDCADYNILWKILKEMGIPDHLTCFLRNRGEGDNRGWDGWMASSTR